MLVIEGLRRLGFGPFELEVATGECVGIGGPSGAGKSVFLRMIADLDPNEGEVVPRDAQPESRPNQETETSLGTGASPYGLFRVPEPVTAADVNYVTAAVVRKAHFLAHARDNFAALDPHSNGYLTLAGLPQSPVERLIGRARRAD